MGSGEDHTDNYDNYVYNIEICRAAGLIHKTLKSTDQIVGSHFATSFTCNSGDTLYLTATAKDRLDGSDQLEGYGSIYYFK